MLSIEEVKALKFPRLKIHHFDVLHHLFDTLHEFQVRRVLLKIVLSVFLALEFAHETVAESTLGPISIVVGGSFN